MVSWDLREICALHLKCEKSVLIPCKLVAAVWCVDCYDNFLCAEIFSAAELTKIACAYSRVDSRATLLWYELCEILTKLVTLHLSTLVGQFEMRIWLGDRATLLEGKNWNRSRLIKSQFCPKKFSLLVNAYIFWWIECWSISAQPVRSSPLRWMCAVDISFRHLLPPLAAAFSIKQPTSLTFPSDDVDNGLELQEEKKHTHENEVEWATSERTSTTSQTSSSELL